MSGAITLAALAGKIAVLEVACSRCDRAGRLNVARLTRQHGPHAGLPMLRHVIAADCPRRVAVSLYDLCGVFYPQLAGLFGAVRGGSAIAFVLSLNLRRRHLHGSQRAMVAWSALEPSRGSLSTTMRIVHCRPSP